MVPVGLLFSLACLAQLISVWHPPPNWGTVTGCWLIGCKPEAAEGALQRQSCRGGSQQMESRGMERARDQELRIHYGSLALAGLKPAHPEPFCYLRLCIIFSVSQLGLGFCYLQPTVLIQMSQIRLILLFAYSLTWHKKDDTSKDWD